ncbi:MAG: hypothetical protein JNJ46_26075 [Myxococcales bacterium]|nr:hypothetical protein [Myxococcales bacterium]
MPLFWLVLSLFLLGASGCSRKAATSPQQKKQTGTTAASAAPVAGGYVDICVGDRHSCAVTATGGVSCWGSAEQGELGVPGLRRSSVPVAVAIPDAVVQVRCNRSLTCARTRKDHVYCWGDDERMSPDPATQPLPPTNVVGLAGSADLWVLPQAVCGLVAAEVRCDGLALADAPLGLRPLRFVPTPQRTQQVCVVAADARGSEDAICRLGREVPRHGAQPRPPIAPKRKGDLRERSDSPSAERPQTQAPAQPSSPQAPPIPWASAGTLQAAVFWGGSLCRFYAAGPVCDPLLQPGVKKALAGAGRAQVLAVSDDVLCLRRDDGGAACTTWMGSRLAYAAAGLGPLRALALSETHACAVLADGSARCWGEASHGELGDGSRYEITTPRAVFHHAVELAVADDFTCARRADGQVHCWGALLHCDVDERCERVMAPRPMPMPQPARSVTLGSSLSTRRLCSQGSSGWFCRFGEWLAVPRLPVPLASMQGGLLGQDGRTWDWAPANPPESPRPHFFQLAGRRVERLSSDGYCAIEPSGRVICGHCGVCSAQQAREILTTLVEPATAVAVSRLIHDGGAHGVCALTRAGTVGCTDLDRAPWQRADVQRPLLSDATGSLRDVQALAFADASAQGLGFFGCVLHNDGGVRCLGNNFAGQLGDGTVTSRRQAQPLIGLPPATAIGVGRDHACALAQTGDVYCWGSARRGAVGVGLPGFQDTPTAVAGTARGSDALAPSP